MGEASMVHMVSALMAGLALLAPGGAHADPVADFYKGRTVNMLVGVSAGGEYDTHARLVARHIGRHIPGNPTLVPQNMTGAGGIIMANYLYGVAPKDGTFMGVIQNGHPTIQAVGLQNVQFDAARFNWIGAITPTVETMALWKTAGVRSVEEARAKGEIVVGSVGVSNITYTFPQMLNEFAGTKFKIISGYRGGSEINLAMERGEVLGRNNTWSSWKTTKPEWLAHKDIALISYAGPKPRDLDGVSSLEDLARSDDDRKVIRLITAGTRLGRPIAATPDVPRDRVTALRAAFQATMKDPEFIKEAQGARIDVDPISGEDLARVVEDVLATPAHLRERAKPFLQ
ncbi:MAG: tripartite tricarboxylate transporter family receptor [Hyphomicrobiales bacterium]|nr:tripartite tricarboxylate transporter family receptor [Hyphomicrobiales bacterium]